LDAGRRSDIFPVHDGRIFLSSTLIDGRFTIRMAALALRTHRRTIDLTLRSLREQAASL
jgi:hypothetical protein